MARTYLMLLLGTAIALVPVASGQDGTVLAPGASSPDHCALLPVPTPDGGWQFVRTTGPLDHGTLEMRSRREASGGPGELARIDVPVRVPGVAPTLGQGSWFAHLGFHFEWIRDAGFATEPSHVNLEWRLAALVDGREVASQGGTTTLRTSDGHPELDLPDWRSWSFRLDPSAAPGEARLNDATLRIEFRVAAPERPVPVGSAGEARVRFEFDFASIDPRLGLPLTFEAPSACGDVDHDGASVPPESSASCVEAPCRRPHAHRGDPQEPADGSGPYAPIARSANTPTPVPVDDWRPWAVTASIGIAGFTAFRSRRPS